MTNIITTIFLSISLAMDAFSLSIALGTILNKKETKYLIIFIGFFHLIMPILGALVAIKVSNLVNIDGNNILGIILLILAIQILISSLDEKNEDRKFTIYEILLLAFSVSLDSFTVGFGLSFEETNILISSILFSIFSMIFTLAGLVIGKYTKNIMGTYSKRLSIIILFTLGIIHLIL